MQARLAEVVTLIRRREANPITIDDIETMDAMEMLGLAKVPHPPEPLLGDLVFCPGTISDTEAPHTTIPTTLRPWTPWRSWASQGAINELRQSMHTP